MLILIRILATTWYLMRRRGIGEIILHFLYYLLIVGFIALMAVSNVVGASIVMQLISHALNILLLVVFLRMDKHTRSLERLHEIEIRSLNRIIESKDRSIRILRADYKGEDK